MPIPNPETPPAGATPPAEPATPPEPITLTHDQLPAELKGKSPAEIQLMLSQMPSIVRNQRDTIAQLEDRIRTPPAPAAPPPPPAEPVDFDALMEENPQAALDHYMTSRYGTTIENIDARLGNNDVSQVAANTPGFAEHEAEVRTLLAQSNTPINEQNIRGAYAMVIGQKELVRQDTLRRAAASEPPVAPTPIDPVGAPSELTALEGEVAAAMGLSHEDFRKYGDAESFQPKIRVS